ncbi:glycoside hydrolase family 3 C-terminal domain-containing protein [Actinosynnema pretiosum subsp. pretiosum]|uniref:Glycoside hydrolase family 3 C-terminal domain-containing protein n=1 Tax=Actinosynnema pretiosum subsp. pretiosum TaxID=103721 RepID=A0AA45L5S6_9PSEU|nr:Beta-glucosidase [Actinosynnema pretiosum subsp. pretiosum]QUF04034.1 glycoside hydrolase family 3 C-terminal domain-containing protein [Actinosynnema pretiosum subsp. pretiosum]
MITASALSPQNRVGQVNQRLKGWEALRWVDGAPRVTDVLKREVDRFGGLGAIYGVLRADPWSEVNWRNGIPPERSAEACAAVQEYVTRNGCGVPVLFVEEVPHGLQALGGTTLPVNLALGAGMDAGLTEELAAAVAAEVRARGTHVALVSGLDVLRDPRWGRAEECFGEDPALAALLVAATVRGMQGTAPGPIGAGRVAVVAKHLAAQGAGIGGRNGSGAPIGPRELGEVHLRPAHAAARAGVAGFMAAYNDVDGVPCTGNRELLTGVLREDWGWDGIVMADGTAIDRLRDSTPDPAAAAALALRAGVDLSLWDEAFTHLGEALDRGLVAEAELDRAVDRVLALKRRVGLLDEPAPVASGPAASGPVVDLPASRDVARLVDRAARQAVVLVRDDGVLPLDPSGVVALIGPNADDLDAQLGDYTPPRPADDPGASTVRSALVARLGEERVPHAPGSRVRSALGPDALAAARDAVDRADVCVLVLGGTSKRSYDDEFADNGAVAESAADTTNGEGVDLASIALPLPQLELARAARSSGKPVVAVVVDGRPRALTELAGLVDALLVVPFPGPSGGAAVVGALLDGTASGRLPASFPVADGVFPVAHDERVETARGYADQRRPVGIPFGSGSPPSVTTRVREGEHRISAAALESGGSLRVAVEVVSTGGPRSVAVPLYGRRHELGVRPRRRTLLAVRRVLCEPGESVVEFALGLDELGSWATGRPVALPVEIGAWSGDEVDEPADAVRISVTDEGGSTPWRR